jgi:hypothetical protein
MIFNFSIKIYEWLYDINFQSNDEFCEICTRYNVIYDSSAMEYLKKWSILKFSL